MIVLGLFFANNNKVTKKMGDVNIIIIEPTDGRVNIVASSKY